MTQKQDITAVTLFANIPLDYRISGLAFRIPGTPTTGRYARSVDGDWYRIRGRSLRAVWADSVDAEVLARGASEISRIIEGER